MTDVAVPVVLEIDAISSFGELSALVSESHFLGRRDAASHDEPGLRSVIQLGDNERHSVALSSIALPANVIRLGTERT